MKNVNREVLNLSKKHFAFSEWKWLSAIIFLGFLLRLAAILLYPHVPESDELAYLNMAKSLVAGKTMTDGAGGYAFYNMGYSFFVLAPTLSLFNHSILALRLANVVCGVIAIALVYAVAREAGASRTARLLSAGLWALYLPCGVYGVYLAKENLMIPLILGVLWCALRMIRAFQLGVAALCGGLLGLLALTGNAALSLVGAVAVALLMSKSAPRVRILSIPIMLVVATLVASPWLVRNVAVLGAPILNSNGGFNLYLGNNPAADGMFVSIADTPRGPTWHALRAQEGEVQASETLKHDALAWIKSHPGEFFALSVKKLGLFWMPPIHNGRDAPVGAEKLIRFIWLIEFSVLVCAAVATLPYVRTRPPLAVLWAAVAFYSAVHMLFYVIFRYREPIMPVLCVLAAMMLEQAAVVVVKFARQRVRPSGG
jgi:4-amino-4-deoxy-L-arabinose transferase-like glycosyltransferase